MIEWALEDLFPRPQVTANASSVLFRHIDKLACCDVVLVEKQLAKKNYEAARLAQHVLSWFAIVLPHVKTVHYHAHNKTSFFAALSAHSSRATTFPVLAAVVCRDKRERKKFCISVAIEYLAITGQDEALAQLLSSPKKDDLANTLCQALAYLKVDV